jgi:hypothetical protein
MFCVTWANLRLSTFRNSYYLIHKCVLVPLNFGFDANFPFLGILKKTIEHVLPTAREQIQLKLRMKIDTYDSGRNIIAKHLPTLQNGNIPLPRNF